MDRSVTAALLSALVFPGVGQLLLKRPARACIFLVPALLASVFFFDRVIARASSIADQILNGSLPLDPALIAARLERPYDNSTLMTVCLVVMALCWIASTVDAYLLGRAARH
jgi:hypothetical protein